jgi:hypothetical protein
MVLDSGWVVDRQGWGLEEEGRLGDWGNEGMRNVGGGEVGWRWMG